MTTEDPPLSEADAKLIAENWQEYVDEWIEALDPYGYQRDRGSF